MSVLARHPDPYMTAHSIQRCAEMGVSTKVAKRILRNPTLVLPDFRGNPNRRFVHSCDEPGYAVIVELGRPRGDDRDTVITLLYYSPEERFERP